MIIIIYVQRIRILRLRGGFRHTSNVSHGAKIQKNHKSDFSSVKEWELLKQSFSFQYKE